MRKYLLLPGEVTSKSDGDRHYISATQLANLYGVSMDECEVVDNNRPETYRGKDFSGLIRLLPKYDGNYTLPTVAVNKTNEITEELF